MLFTLTSDMGLGANNLIELSLNCVKIEYGQFSFFRSVSVKHWPAQTTLVYDLCIKCTMSDMRPT